MTQFTLDELTRLLRAAGGVEEGVDLDESILDQPFTDLGYDSLAILEMSTKIQQEYGVAIPDADVESLTTPRMTIDYLNNRLTRI